MVRELGKQKILNVDLSSGQTSVQEVPTDELKGLLGGRGLAAKILYERLKPGTDPLGPENILIFAPGTFSGTNAPSSGRTTVTCKGPATGFYLKVSGGGHVGAELKYAGYDYIVISGKAEEPVYLWIHNGEIEIRDAGHLWGKGTRETDRLIKNELGDENIQTALIGPAGENKVLFSCIILSLYNSASRGGVGAVMGSKNLKAIAVRGTGALRAADGKGFFKLASDIRKEMATDTSANTMHQWGTAGFIPGLNALGMLPTCNFSKTTIEGGERLSGQYLEDEGFLVGRESCFACSIACHRYVRTKEHRYGEVNDSGPELETMMSLGAECGITDTEAVLKANQLCNDYGIDTISTGHVMAWAMETYEKGLITEKEAEGLDLRFGNASAMVELVRRMALREGWLGDLLAEGTKRAAERIGGDAWMWAIQAKGLEQSACDTRGAKGYALGFALNPRGPDHLTTEAIAEFGFTEEAKALIKHITGDEKYAVSTITDKRPEIVVWHEDCYAASDALGFCAFTSTASYNVNPERMAKLFGYATGIEISEQELMLAGRRIMTLERCFNVREGYRREHDTLPWRMMNDPIPDGINKGLVTDKEMLDKMLDEYFKLTGWDPTTGIPTREELERLGLLKLCGDAASA